MSFGGHRGGPARRPRRPSTFWRIEQASRAGRKSIDDANDAVTFAFEDGIDLAAPLPPLVTTKWVHNCQFRVLTQLSTVVHGPPCSAFRPRIAYRMTRTTARGDRRCLAGRTRECRIKASPKSARQSTAPAAWEEPSCQLHESTTQSTCQSRRTLQRWRDKRRRRRRPGDDPGEHPQRRRVDCGGVAGRREPRPRRPHAVPGSPPDGADHGRRDEAEGTRRRPQPAAVMGPGPPRPRRSIDRSAGRHRRPAPTRCPTL
jgi:hypothetical protein